MSEHWADKWKHPVEDASVTVRLETKPTFQSFNIDVSKQTPAQQMKTVRKWKAWLRTHFPTS